MDPAIVGLVAAAVAASGGGLSAFVANRFGRAVDRERAELTEELLPDGATPEHPTLEEKDSAKFTKLLIRYYSYGLTQARASFYVSLFASIIGGGILITGIGLAIFHADTIGDQYASIVSSVAGLLTVAIGTLFHKRADAALRHMESQSRGLREDMKAERDADQAIRLLHEVDEDHLKSHLQAALILKFSGSELPDLGKVVTRFDLFDKLSSDTSTTMQPTDSRTPSSSSPTDGDGLAAPPSPPAR
ncbi:TRADD-N-associated membrane domain-containing protein [Streptomyces sp. C-3]